MEDFKNEREKSFSSSELHALLQTLMARGCLALGEAEEIFEMICGRSSSNQFQEAVVAINRDIEFAHLKIKFIRFRDPESETVDSYVGIVNTTSDSASALVTRYSALQVAYFRTIVEALSEQPNKILGSKDAINLGLNMTYYDPSKSQADPDATQSDTQAQTQHSDKRMSATEKQTTIARLVDDGWLMKTSDGCLSVGPRSVMEIQPFLLSLDLDLDADSTDQR